MQPCADRRGTAARQRAAAVLRLAAWTASLVAGLWLLSLLGRHVLAGPPSLAPRRVVEWAGSRPPQLAAFGLVRLVAVGMGWYLLALTAIATVARAFGAVQAAGVVRRLGVPAVRPLIAALLGLSIGAGTLAAPAAAAEGPPGGPVMVRLPGAAGAGPSQDPSRGNGERPGAPAGAAAGPATPGSGAPGMTGYPAGGSRGGPSGPDAPKTSQATVPSGGAGTMAAGETTAPAAGGTGSAPAGGGSGGPAGAGPEQGERGGAQPTNAQGGRGTGGQRATSTSPSRAPGGKGTAGGPAQGVPPGPSGPGEGAGTGGSSPPGTPGGTWTTAPGDSLWAIAARALQEAGGPAPADAQVAPYWELVVQANRDRLAEPADPDLIYPGQVFVLPPLPSP